MNIKAQHEALTEKRSKERRSRNTKDMLRYRLEKIICYEFGNDVSLQAQFFLIMPCPDKDRPEACPDSAFDIDTLVADEKRSAPVDIEPFPEEIPDSLLNHPGGRLPAVDETIVLGIGILWM
jgi:hypothetical protein